MKIIFLSALFALGLGIAGTTGATAAPISNGISNNLTTNSLLEEVQYYRRGRVRCRNVRVCRSGFYGRRCHVERVCRRVY